MIKGHVQIELHNHKTGLKDRIEQDNMVTDAIADICAAYAQNGRTVLEDTNLTPLATVGLGGLMIFDNTITANAKNYYFPSEGKFVACAGNYVDTESPIRGSKNAAETGWVDSNTYLHVWDFNTSQANSVIKSLGLTHVDAGANPLDYKQLIEGYGYNTPASGAIGEPAYPMKYDYDDLESIVMSRFGESSGPSVGTKTFYELKKHIADIPISMNLNNIFTASTGVPVPTGYSREMFSACVVGNYTYFVYYTWAGQGLSSSNCNIGRINLETLGVEYGLLSSDLYYTNYAVPGLCYANGNLYMSAPSGVNVYNLSDMSLDRNIDTGTSGGMLDNFGGNCVCNVSAGKVIYPNDTVVTLPSTGSLGYGLHNTKDGMACFRAQGLYHFKNYLGTIANLAQPVEKTSSTSMKVKYTITQAS